MNRRKIRRYRNQRGNSGVKFLGIIGIMIVAVICGYLTARFVIAPLLGYDAEVLKLDFPSQLTGAAEDEDKTEGSEKSAEEDGGYALQFGLFDSKRRAEDLKEKLENEGIDAEIRKEKDRYKVLSPLADTREEALEILKNTESDYVDDIFITKI